MVESKDIEDSTDKLSTDKPPSLELITTEDVEEDRVVKKKKEKELFDTEEHHLFSDGSD